MLYTVIIFYGYSRKYNHNIMKKKNNEDNSSGYQQEQKPMPYVLNALKIFYTMTFLQLKTNLDVKMQCHNV